MPPPPEGVPPPPLVSPEVVPPVAPVLSAGGVTAPPFGLFGSTVPGAGGIIDSAV